MELNGARSNPRLQVELARLGELHHRLLREAAANPQQQPVQLPRSRARCLRRSVWFSSSPGSRCGRARSMQPQKGSRPRRSSGRPSKPRLRRARQDHGHASTGCATACTSPSNESASRKTRTLQSAVDTRLLRKAVIAACMPAPGAHSPAPEPRSLSKRRGTIPDSFESAASATASRSHPERPLRLSPLDSGAASLHDRVGWCAISRPAS